jgi:hypothetical protein
MNVVLRTTLEHLLRHQPVNLNEVGELYRHALIDLGMMEPPLVEVDGELVFATPAAVDALNASAAP